MHTNPQPRHRQVSPPQRRADPGADVLDSADGRTLAAIGLSEDEERAYLALLTLQDSTLPPLAHKLGYDNDRTRALLEALEFDGLVTRSPEPTPRYLAAPPEVAIEALIGRRLDELARTREALADLSRLANHTTDVPTGSDEGDRLIEVLTGREATALRHARIQCEARREVIAIERNPRLWMDRSDAAEAEAKALTRGVAYRVIYDRSVFDTAGELDRIRGFVTIDEKARVFGGVPARVIAADHHAGLIPLDAQHPDSHAVLIGSSPLLDILYGVFDLLWHRATPITFEADGHIKARGGAEQADADTRAIIALLAAGLKDKVIAQQLGLSTRTLDRRIAALMRTLGAATRFQAGWLAGSLDHASHDQDDESTHWPLQPVRDTEEN